MSRRNVLLNGSPMPGTGAGHVVKTTGMQTKPAAIAAQTDTNLRARNAGAVTSMRNASLAKTEKPPAVTDADIKQAYTTAPLPKTREALDKVVSMAELADFVYHRDASKLPPGWKTVGDDVLRDLSQKMGIALREDTQNPAGTLVDKHSGLVATVLHNPATNSVVVAFGGTFAGDYAAVPSPHMANQNRHIAAHQWVTNAAEGLGEFCKSYDQARQLVGLVGQMTSGGEAAGPGGLKGGRSSPLAQCELQVVGHSKGGGEAAFAALSQKNPPRAHVFSPAHLSDSAIRMLPRENVQAAKDLVQAYSVEGDTVPRLREHLSFIGIKGVGTEHMIPADKSRGMFSTGMPKTLDVHVNNVAHLKAVRDAAASMPQAAPAA